MKLYKILGSLNSTGNKGIELTVIEIEAEEKSNTYQFQGERSKRNIKKALINKIECTSSEIRSLSYRVYVLEENIEWAKKEIENSILKRIESFEEQLLHLNRNAKEPLETKVLKYNEILL